MKNVNILGVYWKIRLLEGGSRKTSIEGGIAQKGGAWTVYRFNGGAWQERGRGVDTPMHSMATFPITSMFDAPQISLT